MGENRFMHVRLGAPSELSPPQADGETRSVEGRVYALVLRGKTGPIHVPNPGSTFL